MPEISKGGNHMNEYFPTVVQVIPLDNFHVQVFFDDGKIVDYDARRFESRNI